MPYVPSEKSDPPAEDRKMIDAAVEPLALHIAFSVEGNMTLLRLYKRFFIEIAEAVKGLALKRPGYGSVRLARKLGLAVYDAGEAYGYEGAFLGELNYAITRLIQRVPQILVERGIWKDEFRYWMYAVTVAALKYASRHTEDFELGIDGVFTDIKDEYKRRVNTAYEAAQIVKSGDCYDAPYYTKLVEVINEDGVVIGHQEIMLKRDKKTLSQDMLDYQIMVKKRPDSST